MTTVAWPDSPGLLAEAVARSLNRRSFLTASGSLAVAAMLPLPLPGATPGMTADGWLSDWTIDDMWGVWPRPAEAIGYGRPPDEPGPVADPADMAWISLL